MKSSKNCEKCGQSKEWSGDNINCPFKTQNIFSDNWNCGHISKIRRICNLAMNRDDHRLHYQYCDNQNYVTINTSNVGNELGLCLWVTWYKSRGTVDEMWILSEEGEPKKPTFEQLQLIIDYYAEAVEQKEQGLT